MYERIKYWYNAGLWTLDKVANAVKKGVITAEQYREITGEDYEEGSSFGQ